MTGGGSNLSTLPEILSKTIGGDHHYNKVFLICLDSNDYVTYEKTDDFLNDNYTCYDVSQSEKGDTINNKRRIVSDADTSRNKQKKKKTSMTHCDNPIAYTKHITKRVFDKSIYADQGLIEELARTAYAEGSSFNLSESAIQHFITKKITNMMSKKKTKSKKFSASEKNLIKQMIRALLLRQRLQNKKI